MIYCIVGDNFEERKKALEKLSKEYQLENRTYDKDTLDLNELSGLVSSDGLFGDKYFIQLRDTLSESDIFAYYTDNIDEMRNSSSVMCVIEEKITKPNLKKIGFIPEEIIELPKSLKKSNDFNLFSLTDALAGLDKKNLWVLYQKALQSGVSPEEVTPILLWQLKTSTLALRSSNASEAGLKPFVFNKATRGKMNLGKAQDLYTRLLAIYHDSRRGSNLSDDLEHFMLTL